MIRKRSIRPYYDINSNMPMKKVPNKNIYTHGILKTRIVIADSVSHHCATLDALVEIKNCLIDWHGRTMEEKDDDDRLPQTGAGG